MQDAEDVQKIKKKKRTTNIETVGLIKMAHKQQGFYVVMRSDDPVFLQELFGGQLLMAPMFGSSAVARPLTPPTRTVDGVVFLPFYFRLFPADV